MPPLYSAKLLFPESRQMAQEVDTQLCTSLILLFLPLQIEFVTGTKKGTTTNATATTTTTASTAVAGRGGSSQRCSALLQGQPYRVKAFWACLGKGLGPGSALPCSSLSLECENQLWSLGWAPIDCLPSGFLGQAPSFLFQTPLWPAVGKGLNFQWS
jgi:hypothetical protein